MKGAGENHQRFMEQVLPKYNHKLLRGDSQQHTCASQRLSRENQADVLCPVLLSSLCWNCTQK